VRWRLTEAKTGSPDKRALPAFWIGPRRFFDLFSLKLSSGYVIERKVDGVMSEWDQRRDSKPRVPMTPTSYLEREQLIQTTLNSVFSTKRDEEDHGKSTRTAGQERGRVLDARGADTRRVENWPEWKIGESATIQQLETSTTDSNSGSAPKESTAGSAPRR
jgi:hypothetical protein